jgi:hypothetical protein
MQLVRSTAAPAPVLSTETEGGKTQSKDESFHQTNLSSSQIRHFGNGRGEKP